MTVRLPRAIEAFVAPIVLFFVLAAAGPLTAQEESGALEGSDLAFLQARNLGGAFMSGRIIEVAVDPKDSNTWYVAAASGGVWKTTNAGVTFSPVFDRYGSYSIGTVTVDPTTTSTVWVGTGENNAQRSVAYGDGIYRSLDGGRSFSNMGLEESEHIARIVVDPRDSNRVIVAAQGPLWRAGGDRGVYLTEDGGETWRRTLEVDEWTGASDLVMDPRNPDVLYASTWQRARRVWTMIAGGPGSGIYKSTDGGETWREIESGIPGGDRGRIGLAIAPTAPDVVYAMVELPGGEGGFYRSDNGGESWNRMSGASSGGAMYYQEIYVDRHDPNTIYSMDTFLQVSRDAGRTWGQWGEANKHVDNHAWWQDPHDLEHILVGSDGGLYETFDGGRTFRFFTNLPLAQYYKVAAGPGDPAPFYRVYGGTQDNATHGVPVRTRNTHGVRHGDWFTTVFGDGFGPAADPENPDVVYSQWQHGGLVRYDHASGEAVDIKPRESADGPPLVWNWDSPLVVSPHDPATLYYGAQILFRSDDRGDSWRAVSPVLTRELDRNALEIMDRVWSVDAVAKNASTSQYGNLVAVSESPLVEGLLYVGSDDGLVQVSEDGGATWRRIESESIDGVPELAYVNDIEASLHDPNTVYVAFNDHKSGNFRPYLFVSRDRGRSWSSISGDLPERGSTYTIVQDHEQAGLMFAGTEFGVYVTRNEGSNWTRLGAGIPTVAFRDLVIQREADDLVAGSFGRGFYVLHDYSPLRHVSGEQAGARVFPVKPAVAYQEVTPLGVGDFYPGDPGKAFQGADFHVDLNPSFGAAITYRLEESLQTREAERQAAEREQQAAGEDSPYPSWEELRFEDREEAPAVVLTIRDIDGDVVRRVTGPTSAGTHRVYWDLRYPGVTPVTAGTSSDGNGPMVAPGRFTVEVASFHESTFTTLTEPVEFQVTSVGEHTLPLPDREDSFAFHRNAGELQRRVMGANSALQTALQNVRAMKNAILRDPAGTPELRDEARALELTLMDLGEVMNGDPTRPRRFEPAMPGIVGRLGTAIGGAAGSSYGPTGTHREQVDIARAAFEAVRPALEQAVDTDVPAFAARLEALGFRWTPGMGVPGGA